MKVKNFLPSSLIINIFSIISRRSIMSDQSDHKCGCNFGGQTLRVAVSQQAPFVNCNQNSFGDWSCEGSNIEVIKILQRAFNFNTDWLVIVDNHQTNVNSWTRNSLLNLIESGKALMSANGFVKTPDREHSDRVKLSEPFDVFKLHFLLSKTVRDHDHIFIKPFNYDTWLAILLSALLVVPIFYLIDRSSYHYMAKHNRLLSNIPSRECIKRVWTRLIEIKSQITTRSWRSSFFCASTKKRSSFDSSSESTISFCEKVERMITFGPDFIPGIRELNESVARRRQREINKKKFLNSIREAKQLKYSKETKSSFSKVGYIIWYVVASLATQGGETEDLPSASSSRILVAFWWFYLIVIGAIHSGILTAILTFPKQNDYIQTLDDFLNFILAERNPIKLSVDKDSEIAHLLSRNENIMNSPLKLLFNTKYNHESNNTSISDELYIQKVDFKNHRERVLDDIFRGRLTMIEERSTINSIITSEHFDQQPPKCLFKSSRYPIDVIPMSLLFSNLIGDECIRSFNRYLKRIMEVGLAQRWRRKFEVQGNDCLNSVIINAGDIKKVGFSQVELAFWLLLFGITTGFGALIAEVLWLVTSESESEGAPSLSSTTPTESEMTSDDSLDDDMPRLGYKFGKRRLHPKGHRLRTSGLLDDSKFKIMPEIEHVQPPAELNRRKSSNRRPSFMIRRSLTKNDRRKVNKKKTQFKSSLIQIREYRGTAKQRFRRWRKVVTLMKQLDPVKIYPSVGTIQRTNPPLKPTRQIVSSYR